MPRSHRLTIRVSDHSQSTESDRTPSDHTDDEEYSTGVPLDSVSTGSQVDYTDEEDIVEDDFVRLGYRHVRRPAHVEGDDIEPSDSASRPATSRQSSQHRGPGGEAPGRGHSRRRNPAPDPPPHPRPARGGPRVPREPPLGRPPRPESIHGPESFHSDSLDHDDYPYGGPGGLPYRPGRAPGWGHVPTGYGFPEPSVLTTPDHFARQDMMQPYRDPFYDNPFAAQGGPPYDDMYEPMPPPQRRPRPPMRHSMGAREFALMPYGRDPYGYDPYGRDPYSYGRRPLPPEMRSLSPEKHSHAPEHHSKPPTPAAAPPPPVAIPPMPIPSPGDERLAKLELLILEQTEDNRRRAHDKMALRAEEERKKKQAEEKTQSEKLIALEKLLLKQNEEAIAREKAMEKKREAAEASAAAKMAKEAAEKAATEKIAKELQEAADKAKKAAEAEAEKKAKEAKDAADKELAALKEKHDAAEEAKKKAEEEAEKLKPKGTPAPIRFKDAVGRKFQFPYDICKTWKGMEGLIKQAFLHVDLLGPHVLEGHYDLIGPDGEIILPQVWETMIKPDYAIEMQMWPIPELEKGKDKLPFPMPGGHGHGHGGPHGGPPGMMPAIDDLLKGIGGGKREKGHKGKKGAKVVIPPLPPLGSVIPPPPGGPMMGGPMMGGLPPMPGGIPPPPLGPIGGAGPGLAALSLGEDPMRRKKSGKSKSKNEVPAIMRWAAGSKRR